MDVDTYVGEQIVNESPSPSSCPPSPQRNDVTPTPIDSIPSKEVDDLKKSESVNDSTLPRDYSNPFLCF